MEESGVIGAGLSIGVPFFRRRWSHDSAREAQDDQDDDEREDTRRAVVRRDKARADEEDLDKASNQYCSEDL